MLFGCTRRNTYLLTLLLGLREPLHQSYIEDIYTLWQSTRVIAIKPLASLDVTMSVSESVLSVKTLNLTAICHTKWILSVMMETMLCHLFNHNDKFSCPVHGTMV